MAKGEKRRFENRGGDRDNRDSRDSRDNRGGSRERQRPTQFTRTNHRLLIENLSSGVSWQVILLIYQDLKDFFRSSGEVSFADAHKRRDGEGIVEFVNYDDMRDALRKFDDYEMKGKRIRLREAGGGDRSPKRRYSRQPPRRRERSRSRSRSPNQRRDRTRSPPRRNRSNSR